MSIIAATITEDTIKLISKICEKSNNLKMFEKHTGLKLDDNSILIRAALTHFLSCPPKDTKEFELLKGACQRPASFSSFLQNLVRGGS